VTIGYPDLAALPPELWDAVTKHGSLNVYRMIVHSPGLASGFVALAGAVLQPNSLSAHWRELAIREEVLELLTVTQLADLVITVGFYQLVCDFLNTFHVTTDGEGQPA
jgi:hypothetical protein